MCLGFYLTGCCVEKAIVIVLSILLQGCASHHKLDLLPSYNMDTYTSVKLEELFPLVQTERVKWMKEPKVEQISSSLLGTPYKANTLIGSVGAPEKLVVSLRYLDCFTFIESIEALRRSETSRDYIKQLVKVRYTKSKVDFSSRRHFFTDWASGKEYLAQDVTDRLGVATKVIDKDLNIKDDGTKFIPGLSGISRRVIYIPHQLITSEILSHLKDGDYIGVYSKLRGLAVSHVGVFIRTAHGPVFRNASSRSVNRKVVDYPFMDFVSSIPGIVVLRPI